MAWTAPTDHPPLVPEIRVYRRRQSTPHPPQAQRSLAPRWDGDRHPAQAHLALAHRRQRRRGSGLPRPKTAQRQRRKKADEEAAQEAGLRTNQDRDGQASVIPFGLPSYRPCGRTRSRFEGQQQSRKLSSAGSAAGAQTTEVQVTRLGATLTQHPFCDLQHLLPPASSPQTTHVQRASNHIVRRLATREHGGLNLDPNWPSCEMLRLM